MTSRRRVWVTRAEPGATRTAARLADRGFEPVLFPLLRIEPLNPGPPDLRGVSGLIFTSANAVDAFVAPESALARPVFTVGDATARAARDRRYSHVISADGDLARLATVIGALPSTRGAALLHPCALQPAGDLQTLLEDTTEVRPWPVYRTLETAAPAPACDAVLVHSPRGGNALRASLAAGCPADLRVIVAISGAAARAIGSKTSTNIVTAASLDEAAMIEALESALRN